MDYCLHAKTLKFKCFIFFNNRNNKCLDADIQSREVYVTNCDLSKPTQTWEWGFVNETNVRNWLTYGAKLVDDAEIEILKGLNKVLS